MIEFFKHLDYFLFHLINQKLAVPALDGVFMFARNPFYLQIIYACFFVFLIYKFRKNSIGLIIIFLVCMGLTDQISSHFFKGYFHRLRPCWEPLMASTLRSLVPCSSGFSFTSSHAANNMSVAVLYAFILPPAFNKFKIVFVCFALFVGYSQIYVGVHYPIDVLCGFLIGIATGSGCGFFYRKIESRIEMIKQRKFSK